MISLARIDLAVMALVVALAVAWGCGAADDPRPPVTETGSNLPSQGGGAPVTGDQAPSGGANGGGTTPPPANSTGSAGGGIPGATGLGANGNEDSSTIPGTSPTSSSNPNPAPAPAPTSSVGL